MIGTTTTTAAVLCAAGTAVTLGYALRVAFEHDRLLDEDDVPPRSSSARPDLGVLIGQAQHVPVARARPRLLLTVPDLPRQTVPAG